MIIIFDKRKRTQYSFNCSKQSVQWRPNIDEVVIFGAHTSHSLAHSLPPPSPSVPFSPSLTSPNPNSTRRNSINQSINQSDYLHIHSRINLGLHSLIHTLLHSLIHSHNFTHPLAHLIVHAPRNNAIIHSLPHSFNYSHIIQLFLHSPNY